MLPLEQAEVVRISEVEAELPPFEVLPAAAEPMSEHAVVRWAESRVDGPVADQVAEESPVALVYNDRPYAVMMASPQDLTDFGLGFSLAEGVIAGSDELEGLDLVQYPNGLELRMTIPAHRAKALEGRARQLTGRTGCGLCGAATLTEVLRVPPPLGEVAPAPVSAVYRGLAALAEHQRLNARTGALHAAAWIREDGTIALAREDVGRHNALDKLIGALAASRLPTAPGIALVTSRASYEMVQKAAHAGIGILAAVSAPTALAIRMAESCGLTLAGFARDTHLAVYTHTQRLF